jgi:hypothetical protein
MTGPREGLVLAEYKQIKAEQAARIATRDNLIYAVMVAVAGALTISHSAHSRAYLLLVPAVTCILGWTYLMNDQMITAIGAYIRETLPAMRWEREHSADRYRRSRKAGQLAVDLTTFCGPGAAALTAYWLAPGGPLLTSVSVLEAIGTGLLAWQFVRYAIPAVRSGDDAQARPAAHSEAGR